MYPHTHANNEIIHLINNFHLIDIKLLKLQLKGAELTGPLAVMFTLQ